MIQEIPKEKQFDHVLASQNLIKETKDNFKEGKYKDAYGKVSQAIRLFLSYDLNLNKEITNEDILSYLKNTKYPANEINNCFNISTLVEFAKYVPNQEEFEKLPLLIIVFIVPKIMVTRRTTLSLPRHNVHGGMVRRLESVPTWKLNLIKKDCVYL